MKVTRVVKSVQLQPHICSFHPNQAKCLHAPLGSLTFRYAQVMADGVTNESAHQNRAH